jgi:metal-dependent hydrolase (beta-lactamase superfamily II)
MDHAGGHYNRAGRVGFSALIEADGHRVLLDTGAHPDTVLQSARDLKIDLSDVRDVILTHNRKSFGVRMFTVFEAKEGTLGSDERGQSCTGANS